MGRARGQDQRGGLAWSPGLASTFTTSRGLRLDPARNRVQGAAIALEAAILLAGSFGLKVAGFRADAEE